MFDRILVPTDGSDFSSVALDYALLIAGQFSSRLALLHVIDVRRLTGPYVSDLSGAYDPALLGDYFARMSGVLEKKGAQILAAAAARCAEAGVGADTAIVTGIVTARIVEAAKDASFVAMGQRGEHASFGGPLLGSTLESTVRGTSRPVLVTPAAFYPPRRVLVAFDGSRHAEGALRAACELARAWSLPLVLMSASAGKRPAEELVAAGAGFAGGLGVAARTEVVTGEIVDAILTAVHESGGDLLAMGAYGHSRIRELVLGSTTAQVIRRVACPVLLYR